MRAFAKVVAQIPQARLLIAGDGPERRDLAVLIDRLYLNASVCLLGHLSREKLEDCFATVWLQVVPSRWEEPFGIVAAEALMRGTAVVATDAGGTRSLVAHRSTGVIVAQGEEQGIVADLASAIAELASDDALRREMSLASLERSAAFEASRTSPRKAPPEV